MFLANAHAWRGRGREADKGLGVVQTTLKLKKVVQVAVDKDCETFREIRRRNSVWTPRAFLLN